jgi:hypothetical protein
LVKSIANDIPKTVRDGYKQMTSQGKKMKSARPPAFKSILFLAAIFGFILAAMPKVLASAEDQIDSALATSKAWVAQIDAGKYDDSYAFGCGAMHDKVPQDRWAKVLKALRTPWGPVVSRKQISHIYKPNGFEKSEGEFMVITYDTSFQRLASATETVVLKWEDGKWRGAGYQAGPKAPPDNGSTPPSPAPTTETHTEPHAKQPPQ